MNIKHARTAREVKTIEQHGARYEIVCSRTTGFDDGSLTEKNREEDERSKRSRISSAASYESSLRRLKYRGTPCLVFDEVWIKPLSGQLNKSFRVDLSKPEIESDTASETAAPSVGRIQTPVVLDFASVMPAPIVNVAPAPAPVVNIQNELPPPPPPPPPVKELRIIRDDDGKITGALIS